MCDFDVLLNILDQGFFRNIVVFGANETEDQGIEMVAIKVSWEVMHDMDFL